MGLRPPGRGHSFRGQFAEARRLVGSHLVELDGGRRTVRFSRPGVQLNLAASARVLPFYRCADELIEAGLSDFLIHGGHSSVLARGSGGPSQDPAAEKAGPSASAIRCVSTAGSANSASLTAPWGPRGPSSNRSGIKGGAMVISSTREPASRRRESSRRRCSPPVPPGPTASRRPSTSSDRRTAAAYCREHSEVAAVLICPAQAPAAGRSMSPGRSRRRKGTDSGFGIRNRPPAASQYPSLRALTFAIFLLKV